MNYVWIVFGSDTEHPWVEAVFADKVKAESTLRLLNDQAKAEGHGYFYYIQEKRVTHD